MCTTCGCGMEPHPVSGTHRRVRVEQDLLARNNQLASENRANFRQRGILALDLVSSPGSGKTTLLVQTLRRLKTLLEIRVIEGDQQTRFDADRILAEGVQALQINTGRGCHLDAHGVGHAAEDLAIPDGSLLFIENVGNLVCPALFDLGAAHKVVILSVPEGDDKPSKYPDMFAAASLMIVNKMDLLAHVQFDVERCVRAAREVNPALQVIPLSAATGSNLDAWVAWILAEYQAVSRARDSGGADPDSQAPRTRGAV